MATVPQVGTVLWWQLAVAQVGVLLPAAATES
jgi:hypothetical protein